MSIFNSGKKYLLLLVPFLILVNIFGYQFASNLVRGIIDSRVEMAVGDLENNINTRIRLYENLLRGAVGLFEASDNVTAGRWHSYFANRNIAKEFPGIQVIGYAPVVKPANKANLSALAAQNGVANFQLYPNIETELYVPVLYLEPMSTEVQSVVGFNMYIEPQRREAIEFAIDHNTLAITDKIIPAADQRKAKPGAGVVMFMPVYDKGADISTVEGRRANIIGFVTAGVRPEQLMEGVTLQVVPGIKLQIFDDSANGEFSEENLLYNSGDNTFIQPGFISLYPTVKTIEWPNTKWYIRFSGLGNYGLPRLLTLTPYLILAFNILLSILALIVVNGLTKRYQHAKSRAASFSDKLYAEDAMVEAIDSAVVATDINGLITVFNKRAAKMFGYTAKEVVNKKNILDFVTIETVKRQAEELKQRLKSEVKSDFSALVSKSVIQGKDSQKWKLRAKNGISQELNVDIVPLYGNEEKLIGYQMTIQ